MKNKNLQLKEECFSYSSIMSFYSFCSRCWSDGIRLRLIVKPHKGGLEESTRDDETPVEDRVTV